MNEMKQSQIYLKGVNRTQDVKSCERRGKFFKVTFKSGEVFHYNHENVEVIDSVLNDSRSKDCFDYLKEIAHETGLKAEVEDGKIINILANNYNKIEFVPEESVLGAFLSGKFPIERSNKSKRILENNDVIFPFGFNLSQKNAVEKALTNKISIIEGPPGTGKTQTILNVIANVVMREKSVAVVSSSNSATKNVFDKLEKNNVEFIAAFLGNNSNKEDFINAQPPIPLMPDWEILSEDIENLKKDINNQYEQLHEKLALRIKLANFKQELSAYEIEQKHFLSYSNETKSPEDVQVLRGIKNPNEALEIWLLCENEKIRSWFFSFILFVIEIVKYKSSRKLLVQRLLKQYSREYLIGMAQFEFYKLKISELTKEIIKISHDLESFNFNGKMEEYSKLSLKLFKGSLNKTYRSNTRPIYTTRDLKEKSEEFLKDYPVVLSTTYSLKSSLSKDLMYDYLIIDEASQVDLCTGALALSCAKHVIVVGDLKQLPHVVDSKMANITDSIFKSFNLAEFYRYKNQNLLSALVGIFPKVPKTLLREHYRCHPKIIEFCNKKFYGGQLVIMTDDSKNTNPLIVYKTVKGNHERDRVNQRQIDVIKNEIIPEQSLNTTNGSLGIITPYRNQTHSLQKAFFGMNVKADTVDKFQGQENEVVILSTVDNDISDFTDNENRLNVAISRAIDQLIVVVSDSDTLSDTNVGDLVNYIEYNNLSVVASKIFSVFDYLYRSYADQRREYLSKYKRISRFDSENLMYTLIQDVFKEKGITNLDVSTHIPLRMLLWETKLLTPEEFKYAMNYSTHIDLLVFDTLSKTPKLAIEVDGVSFHKDGSRQSERDLMKNEILKKYDLPLLRLRTDGSGEREKLLEALLT